MATIEFGWRLPEFPTDGSDHPTFLGQIAATLDLIHGRFDSAWVADHVGPWASRQAVATPMAECWMTLTFQVRFADFPRRDGIRRFVDAVLPRAR